MAATPKKPTSKKKKPVAVQLLDLLWDRMRRRKAADRVWGISKHHGSKNYLTVPQRRAKRKVERLNRAAGRR